ncbi:MAG: ABC transporter permease [Kiritimatiellae bacterium]|nr:ABC transporter permease [Kiritimatiellia bacterium]
MSSGKIDFDYSLPKTLRIKLSGDWQIAAGIPAVDDAAAQIAAHAGLEKNVFEISEPFRWDSAFLVFLIQLHKECRRKNIYIAPEGLPPKARKLFALVSPAVDNAVLPRQAGNKSFFETAGSRITRIYSGIRLQLDFLGEIVLAFGRLFAGKASFRRDDFLCILQKCGVDALLLVSLISVLVGMIFAFVGAIQLKMFGAQIFVAHIVGIAMVRVMGAIMAGILMAGRTGASFAAELGIMQTNEEIDALKTLGVAPVDFLVVPRMLALIIMLPLLTVYADIMGILGGLIIGVGMLDISALEYWHHTQMAVKLNNIWVGLVNSLAFGIIIAIAGCYHGMQCERSAAGVGKATTAAVVSAITGIVIATAIITFICQILEV